MAKKQECPLDMSSPKNSRFLLCPLGSDVGGDLDNRVGDVCPHHQGVKGIEFPRFPLLRPTEAGQHCELCSLSSSALFSPVYFVSYSNIFLYSLCFYTCTLLVPPSVPFHAPSVSSPLARRYRMQG